MKNQVRKLSQRFGCLAGSTFSLLLFLAFLFLFPPVNASAQQELAIDNKVEEAVLAEDWKKVATLLDTVTPETPSPVLRMIKGHADLALNRNNESLCLFLSVVSEDDLGKWDKWSQNFSQKYPQKAVTHYFRGDAFARLEKWKEAKLIYGKALELNHNHPLTLNARGVVNSLTGKLDDAFNDFANALIEKEDLADSFSNLGMLAILQKEGVRGGLEDFSKSVDISPNFSLALYGRACMSLILGQIDKAEKDFDASFASVNSPEIIILSLINHARKSLDDFDAVDSDTNEDSAGFGVTSKFDSAIDAMDKGDLGFQGSKYKGALTEASAAYARGNHVPLQKLERATIKYIENHGNSNYIDKYNNQIQVEMKAQSLLTNVSEKHSSELSIGTGIGKESKSINNSQLKSSFNLGANYKYENNFTYDLKPVQAGYRRASAGVEQFRERLSGYTGVGKAQGFKTKPDNVNLDEGDWPFTVAYGLMYRSAPED